MVVSELLRARDRGVSEGEQHRVHGTEAPMIWQKPEPSTVLPSGGKVNLVVGPGKLKTLPLASDEGLPPYLSTFRAIFAYATGGAIHLLRLTDGRDVALDLPDAAPSLDARLERRGLFVSWNKMYRRRPGRLAFVPMRIIRSRMSSTRAAALGPS